MTARSPSDGNDLPEFLFQFKIFSVGGEECSASRASRTGNMAGFVERVDQVAMRLSLMANPSRLLALCHLIEVGEACVGDIQRAVGLGQSALSQHLARLRESGIVATRRDRQMIYYRIADRETETMVSALCSALSGDADQSPCADQDIDVIEGVSRPRR